MGSECGFWELIFALVEVQFYSSLGGDRFEVH